MPIQENESIDAKEDGSRYSRQIKSPGLAPVQPNSKSPKEWEINKSNPSITQFDDGITRQSLQFDSFDEMSTQVFTKAEIDYMKRKDEVLKNYYFIREGPVFRHKGLSKYSYGELDFDIVYDKAETPSDEQPEPVLIKDIKHNHVMYLNEFLRLYELKETERALRHNLTNLKEMSPSLDEEEEDLASIGDEFGMSEDERVLFDTNN